MHAIVHLFLSLKIGIYCAVCIASKQRMSLRGGPIEGADVAIFWYNVAIRRYRGQKETPEWVPLTEHCAVKQCLPEDCHGSF